MNKCEWYFKSIKDYQGNIITEDIKGMPSKQMSQDINEQSDAEYEVYRQISEQFLKKIKRNIKAWPICKYGGTVSVNKYRNKNTIIGQWICNCGYHDSNEMPF
jgi:hypothetical protein